MTRAATVSDSPTAGLVHRIPRASLVDRISFVLQHAHGRRVVDLGFVDEGRMQDKRPRRTWLHELLRHVSADLVGIDDDCHGVDLARELGFQAYVADCQTQQSLSALNLEPADLVVGGELIEHLDRPGDFLDAVKCLLRPDGMLLLTTPNAVRLINALAAALGREIGNITHVTWYSWRTLQTLMARHGWSIHEVAFYAIPPLTLSDDWAFDARVKIRGVNALRRTLYPLFRLNPSLADGLIVVATLDPAGGQSLQ